MKFFKEYIITAIVGLLLAVVLIVSAKDEGNTLTNAKQRSYDDNWTVQIGKQEKFYKWLGDIQELPKWMRVAVSSCRHSKGGDCCVEITFE